MAVPERTSPWSRGGDSQSFPGPARANPDIVLVGENGQVVREPSRAFSGGGVRGGGSSGGGTVISAPSTASTSPFVINITYDSSVSSAPAGFTAGVAAAVQYLQSQYTDPIAININVGYGEVGGYTLGSGTLGSSLTYLSSYTYSQVIGALSADATTTNDANAGASLPSTSPVSNANYWVSTAEAKALGLMGANSAVDGYVGFSSTSTFDYNNTDGVTAGTYDFYGTVVHELTEVMGRMLLTGATLGGKANSYDPFDLFHYSSPGVRNFSASTSGYFSVDGGKTNFGGFNTVSGGDAGDWGSGMGNDSFNAFSYAGVVNAVSNFDLIALDAIGWNLASAVPPSTGPTGVTITSATYTTKAVGIGGLATTTPIATFRQSGGSTSDSYTYSQAGPDSASFSLTSAANVGSLAVGGADLPGTRGGTAYNLTITAKDETSGASSPATPLGVVVGTSGADTINVASVLGGATITPAFIYGLDGNDTINASTMTSKLWFAGGAGADSFTGGTGADVYAYGSISDSTAGASTMDVITNFNPAMDLIDLTGLGVALSYAGQIGGLGRLAANSIGWQVSNGNTFLYVNASSVSEKLAAADMKIELLGRVSLTSSDFAHF